MNLTIAQIDVVIEWMNSWEQLRGTVIPIRFKEDFINASTEDSGMYFSYVESGDNFVPDIVTDPFRRIPIKYGMTLSEGASREDAEQKIKTAIKEYIQKNTIIDHTHIQERYIPDELLPEIQVVKNEFGQTLEEQINSCTEFTVLTSYYLIVKNNPTLLNIYEIKKAELQKKEVKQILDLTEARCKK